MLGFKEVSHEVITLQLANKLAAVPLVVRYPKSAVSLEMETVPASAEDGQRLNLEQLFELWGQQPNNRLVWGEGKLRFVDTMSLQDQEIIGLRREEGAYVLIANQSLASLKKKKPG